MKALQKAAKRFHAGGSLYPLNPALDHGRRLRFPAPPEEPEPEPETVGEEGAEVPKPRRLHLMKLNRSCGRCA